MSLKSFSFGLGIGIAFVSILSLVLFRVEVNKIKKAENTTVTAEMSDEEIMKRAKELGMITYSDLPSKKNAEATTNKNVAEDNNKNQAERVTEKATEKVTEKLTEKTTEATTKANSSDTVELTIKSGATARIVSQELNRLGVIDDVEDFRLYLGASGYGKKIMTGKYEIPKNASYDEIIEMIRDKRK